MNRGWVVACLACLAIIASAVIAPAGGAAPQVKAPQNLLADSHWQYQFNRSRTFLDRAPMVQGGEVALIYARTSFDVDDPARYVALEFKPGLDPRQKMHFRLNGQVVPVPEMGMYYWTIPAIPPSLLKAGNNTLEAFISYDNRPPVSKPKLEMPDVFVELQESLLGLEAGDLRFIVGPVLGCCDQGSFSVTCRTNIPSTVALKAVADAGQEGAEVAWSKPGLFHRFKVARDAAVKSYQLVGELNGYTTTAPFDAPAAPTGRRFVIMGDSRTYPEDWLVVAEAAKQAKPEFVIFNGDMTDAGRDDWRWECNFFTPGADLMATVPLYAVWGNHEEKAPVFTKYFYTPGKDGADHNWAQQFGPVLIIGIDGQEEWTPASRNAKWLEKTLAESKAKFIFVNSHYPAYSTGYHGRQDGRGLVIEREMRRSRVVIVPLLIKYKATAFVVGHDHFYERSELPGGLTQVITGGAGAPLLNKNDKKQNPYAKAVAYKLHYTLLEVHGDTCTLKAITPSGQIIDQTSWKARTVK